MADDIMTFTIEPDELIQIKEWQAKQPNPKISTAIGGRWIYEFNPTSIGTFITVKDLANGTEFTPEVNW